MVPVGLPEGAEFQVPGKLSQDAVGVSSCLCLHSAHDLSCLQWQKVSCYVCMWGG